MENTSVPLLLHAANPGLLTGAGNNTWLLDGDEPTLVDAGVGQAAHVDAIARHLDGRPLVRVLVTHGHADHASGVPALRARWPNLEAWKWPGAGESGWQPLTDGQRLPAGAHTLEVVHTPGHAPDHVCFWNVARGDLFAGDMLVLGTTVMIPAGRGGNLCDYLASLERLAALAPRHVYPGHGDVIDRPLELLTEYIEHRRLRERQVLACLDAGMTDADTMVARIYPDLADALRPAARLTIEAHLEKDQTRAMTPTRTESNLRRLLFILLILGGVGIGADLLLLEHYEDGWQLVPLCLVGLLLAIAAWHAVARDAASLRALQVTMIFFVVAGAAGIGLHYRGNLEFQLEIDASQSHWDLFKKVIHAKAPPALAPAAMVQIGLLGLAYAYRHPASAPPDNSVSKGA